MLVPVVGAWPSNEAELIAAQRVLADLHPEPWRPGPDPVVGGCFACLPKGMTGRGMAGDRVWAAAAAYRGRRCVGRANAVGVAAGPYQLGLLALRIGAPLGVALAALAPTPDLVLVDATGRDHPRRAGLAIQLGAVLDLPTVGVTHRTLLAAGDWPADQPGATSRLTLDAETVGYWLRTRAGRRPVAVHAGWRTDPDIAVQIVRAVAARHRTPVPLREARRLARLARDGYGG